MEKGWLKLSGKRTERNQSGVSLYFRVPEVDFVFLLCLLWCQGSLPPSKRKIEDEDSISGFLFSSCFIRKKPEDSMLELFKGINDIVWGPPLLMLLVGTGVYFTVRMGLFQISKLPKAFQE